MKIGLVGYQGSGKSSLFQWLTGVQPDPAMAHTSQSAMAPVPDPRVAELCHIYNPKKITLASLEIVDTPGLSRTHEGNATRLALIREAGCLVHVVAAFDGSNPINDIRNFQEDMVLTDLEIMTGRVERLRESVKKPRPNREEQQTELAALEPLLEQLENGQGLAGVEFTDEQDKATRSFGLLTRKRRIALVNVADDDRELDRFGQAPGIDIPVIGVPIGLEVELSRMSEQEQLEFRHEMGVGSFDRDGLIRQLMAFSGQMLFFTAGEKEVRTWMIPQQTRAVDAAGAIHSDLARGFIRAEIMSCDDLIRLKSEREVKAQNLVRQEHKEYIIQDGDILNIRFSV
jgi:ribosome-binding ATPase YchF (GTP1/OBG family)